MGFDRGDPVSVDGAPCSPRETIERLNHLASRHGIGRADAVESRIVGTKTRCLYETPGGTVIQTARRALEALTLDPEVALLKEELMPRYARLVYRGLWFAPERLMLQAAIDWSQQDVTGEVTVALHKGNVVVQGRSSHKTRYHRADVSFNTDATFARSDPEGFIRMLGLRFRTTESDLRGAFKPSRSP